MTTAEVFTPSCLCGPFGNNKTPIPPILHILQPHESTRPSSHGQDTSTCYASPIPMPWTSHLCAALYNTFLPFTYHHFMPSCCSSPLDLTFLLYFTPCQHFSYCRTVRQLLPSLSPSLPSGSHFLFAFSLVYFHVGQLVNLHAFHISFLYVIRPSIVNISNSGGYETIVVHS